MSMQKLIQLKFKYFLAPLSFACSLIFLYSASTLIEDFTNFLGVFTVSLAPTAAYLFICISYISPRLLRNVAVAVPIALLAATLVTAYKEFDDLIWMSLWMLTGISAISFLIPNGVATETSENTRNGERVWIDDVDCSSARKAIASKMVAEASSMRRTSLWSLLAVGALVVFAVLVVLFAGLITNIDISGSSRLNAAKSYVNESKENYSDIFGNYAEARKERVTAQTNYEAVKRSQSTAVDQTPETAEEMSLILSSAATTVENLTFLEKNLAEELDAAKARRDTAQQIYDKANEDSLGITSQNQSTEQEISALVASAVTRFGVIAVVLFFAQALINLYRYSLRMSAMYQARAVAICLASNNFDDLEMIVKQFSPEGITLGKEPQTPLAQLEKLAELTTKLRSN